MPLPVIARSRSTSTSAFTRSTSAVARRSIQIRQGWIGRMSRSTGMPEPPYRLLTHTARIASAGTPRVRASSTQPAMQSSTASNQTCGHCSAHSGFGVSGR